MKVSTAPKQQRGLLKSALIISKNTAKKEKEK